jgi:N-acetylneuraminic acid mutarotase
MLPSDTSTDRVTVIDPTTGRTTPGPPLAIPVHDAAAGTFAAQPAVYGGGNSTEQSAVQALVRGRWRQVGRLPTTRSDLSVAVVGGRSVVVGGYDGTSVPRSILAQRGHELRPRGQLEHGVRYAATTVVGQAIFVFGGEVDHRELGDVQRVDARTGLTRVVARLPRPLGHAVAVYAGGRVLLMGGRTGLNRQTSAMWWFDPNTHRFTPAGDLPVPMSDSAAVALGRRIWLLGGESPHVTDRVVVVTLS